MSASTTPPRLTVADIGKLHADGQRIAMLTAYDYPSARLLDEASIPFILVGDSVGTVVLGYDSEIRVTMADMLHHTAAVVRGTSRALVVADMPFLSYSTPADAVDNAGRFLREAGAQAVKVEGGVRSARIIEAMGIPILQGRGFTADEQRGTPRVAIVNQPFADEIFGGAALGHALRIGDRACRHSGHGPHRLDAAVEARAGWQGPRAGQDRRPGAKPARRRARGPGGGRLLDRAGIGSRAACDSHH